jgi:hypothetical protein
MDTDYPLDETHKDYHFLITTHAGGHHCRRYFAGQVMDPVDGSIRSFRPEESVQRQCRFHRISMIEGANDLPDS